MGKLNKKRKFHKHSDKIKTATKFQETAPVLKKKKQRGNFDSKTKIILSNASIKMAKKKDPKKKGLPPIDADVIQKYSRGESVDISTIKYNIHKKKLENKEKKINFAVEQSARCEILLTEQPGYLEAEDENEEISLITQRELKESVDITSATKNFELRLDFGPYKVDYTKNGRHLLIGGRRGHVAAFDWMTKKLHCEINVMESVHAIKWLHIETMFAVAQKSWLYIYDNQGIELHCLKNFHKVLCMEFLPYHFLLATSSESGHLGWLDISMGKLVSKFHAKMGRLAQMTQNPHNATVILGHPTGVVTMWSPTVREPLAKLLCQKSSIQAIHVDPSGKYLATAGMDKSINIWDIRAMKPLQSYRMRAVPSSIQLSQKGVLATATGNVVQTYKDCIRNTCDEPYLTYKGNLGSVGNLQFCPFEDVLGLGTERGVASIIIPGSGEANFDAYEQNPYRSKKQRREGEVKALLEKIQPEMITLDPFDIMDVDIPTLHDKIQAQTSLLTMKPPQIGYEPRRKNKKGAGLKAAKTKKILKEEAKLDFVKKTKGVIPDLYKSEIDLETEQEQTTQKRALDRFKISRK